MPFATDSAICGRLSVVDAMFDWLERLQIGEDALQIIIRKVAEVPPGHGRREFAGADMTGANDLCEQRFVVIGDARRIRGDVCGCCFLIPFVRDHLSASVGQAPSSSVGCIVAIVTIGEMRQVLSALYWIRPVGRGHWTAQRSRKA